jgi:hypothetical protein
MGKSTSSAKKRKKSFITLSLGQSSQRLSHLKQSSLLASKSVMKKKV